MKLTLVTQHYAPHFEGGTEAVVRAQAAAFAARGHHVRVVAGTDRPHAGDDVVRHEVDGVEVCLLPRRTDEFYDLLLDRPRVRGLVAELCSGCDLVHVHHWSTLDRELVRTLSAAIPVAVTLHDLFTTCPRFFREPQHGVERCPAAGDFEPCVACVAPDVPTIPRPSIHEGFRQRHAHFQAELDAAALVVAPSRAHLEHVRRYLAVPSERAAVVGHGLSRPFPARAGGTSLAAEAGGPLRVGFLGHRAAIKGAVDLVAALAGLPPALRERVELCYFGDEVEDGVDARIAAAADGLRIEQRGPYELRDLCDSVRAAGGLHLVAVPSRAYESYGLVVDEALALGLPVWVSDRGAPRERVGDAGRVLPAGDPGAWRRAFAEVLEDPASLARERAAVPSAVPTARDAVDRLLARFASLVEACT